MSTKFFVYTSGRWCEIDTETGQVNGYRERVAFVYLSKGKFNVAKKSSVLRGLRALASGHRTTVREGPQLPYKKTRPPEAKRKSRSYDRHEHRSCCTHTHRSSTEPCFNRIVEKPSQVTVATACVATQCTLDIGTQADDLGHREPPKRCHESLTDDAQPTPKRGPNIGQVIELSKALDRNNLANQKVAVSSCRELLIANEDVAVFRNFLIKNKTDVDLNRFDCDDAYKAKIFYTINPLVNVVRSPNIRLQVQEESSQDEMTIKDFAVKLGLLSVDDVKKDKRYKTRNSLNKTKMRVVEDSNLSSTDSDFENSHRNPKKTLFANSKTSSKGLEKQLEPQKNSKQQKQTQSGKTKAFKKILIKEDTSSDDSDDQSAQLKIGLSFNKQKYREKVSSHRDIQRSNRQSVDKTTVKTQINDNQHSDTASSEKSEDNSKVNTRRSFSKKTQFVHAENMSTDEENQADTRGNPKFHNIGRQDVFDKKNVTNRKDVNRKNVKERKYVKNDRNEDVKDLSTDDEVSENNKYPIKRNVAGKDVIQKKQENMKDDVMDRNNVNNRKNVLVHRKGLRNDTDKENRNKKISKEDIRQNILKKLDKELTTHKGGTRVIREKNNITVSDRDNNNQRSERESKTSKLSDEKVVQKVGPKFKVPKRSSVPAGREYTGLEDHVIVAWISTGRRARKVNGNRLWRELQLDYTKLTGQSRSWHSLRNRYLRYLLPALHTLSLPAAQAARLRAAAATGEIKSRKKQSSGTPSRSRSRDVPSAWSLRPRTPRPSPSADKHTLLVDIHLSPSRSGRSSTSTSPLASKETLPPSKNVSLLHSANPSPSRSKRYSRIQRRSSSTSPPRPKNPSPPCSKNSRRRSRTRRISSSSSPPRLKDNFPPRSKNTSPIRSHKSKRPSSPRSGRLSPPRLSHSPSPLRARSARRSLRSAPPTRPAPPAALAPDPVRKTRRLFNPNAPIIIN